MAEPEDAEVAVYMAFYTRNGGQILARLIWSLLTQEGYYTLRNYTTNAAALRKKGVGLADVFQTAHA